MKIELFVKKFYHEAHEEHEEIFNRGLDSYIVNREAYLAGCGRSAGIIYCSGGLPSSTRQSKWPFSEAGEKVVLLTNKRHKMRKREQKMTKNVQIRRAY